MAINPLMRRPPGRNGGRGNKVCVAICSSLVLVLSIALYFTSSSTLCNVGHLPTPSQYYRISLDAEEEGGDGESSSQFRIATIPIPEGGEGWRSISKRLVYVDKRDLDILRSRIPEVLAAAKASAKRLVSEDGAGRSLDGPDDVPPLVKEGLKADRTLVDGGEEEPGQLLEPEETGDDGRATPRQTRMAAGDNEAQSESNGGKSGEDAQAEDQSEAGTSSVAAANDDGTKEATEEGEEARDTSATAEGATAVAEAEAEAEAEGVELVNPPEVVAIPNDDPHHPSKVKTTSEYLELYATKPDASGKTSLAICGQKFFEVVPCLDRQIHKLMDLSLDYSVMQHYERHCPTEELRLRCLVPPPPGYKLPIRWPESRDKVWRANVPHEFLAKEKQDQHWMEVEGETVTFPGGGTHFHDGAAKYIESLADMLGEPNSNLSMGGNIRTVLDVGCGVASFGAFLLPVGIMAMSIAPNDVHQNQIQFALERGIPAMLNVLGTKRLQYPSKSFELAHCSRCRIDWWAGDGRLLVEVNRLLRPGGYFVWSSPPAYSHDPEDVKNWGLMKDLTDRMCWKVVAQKHQSAIFQKPVDNSCYDKREPETQPPMCPEEDDADSAWQKPMQTCLHAIPTTVQGTAGAGGWEPLPAWPSRLSLPPRRLVNAGYDEAYFLKDTSAWQKRAQVYWETMKLEADEVRNVMDMDALFGGLAAALIGKPVWVMNVVPISGKNTLPVIYDRGLIGTLHDWKEAFNSYPRTYDLLHAGHLLSVEEAQGAVLDHMLIEVDRLLRPKGRLIVRDTPENAQKIADKVALLKWEVEAFVDIDRDEISGPEDEKLLILKKKFWATPFRKVVSQS
ncbi:hypothetical protein CBR_g30584 [Chara braunii]|uniref:Methyltransferase n=1 Tax=Chara braunii TaxID=69332 RepID=A0A388LD32_CHABU|nr:hypothetical protein CBR_g30584 [Chara braunii]|eukprot:GBG80217.1 hypothetical protein CBR_g30584 [Chara braunii]